MLAKCINPQCFSPFRYLGEGTLFRRENEQIPAGLSRTRPEYFWLCASCSKVMTLRINEHGEVFPVSVEAVIHGLTDTIDITIREQKYRISLHSIDLSFSSVGGARAEVKHGQEPKIASDSQEEMYEAYAH